MGLGLGTPLSMPTSDEDLPANTVMGMSSFEHTMPPHFYNPFSHHHQQPQDSYAPSSFLHQDTGYETMDQDGSPLADDGRLDVMDTSFHQSPVMAFQPIYDGRMAAMPPTAEKFRFHVTLNAPTAMIKHSDEIPVTYLNKGQAYSVAIHDITPTTPIHPGTRYRTYIRISFEDEQQRLQPTTCWQLWKEGRGTNEAHQRGGKLQAVEYVEATQPAESDDKRTRVELDTASFDGFSVVWAPGANGAAECNLAVRFNFLSTDFSHSKGVKGIPVRLCAKTEIISAGSPHPVAGFSEVAYCKVKLFRDHGAERKLSNDIAHVKKTIDKLKQQIASAETGLKEFGKKKRTGSTVKSLPNQRPGKVQKHKRTWSMSSTSSAGGRVPVEEDHQYKLQMMQDMFTSTRPVSILYLRGANQDDPDLFPVALVGEPLDLTKVDSRDNSWAQRGSARSSTTGPSSLVSPSPSSLSMNSQTHSNASAVMSNAPHWTEFSSLAPPETQHSNPQQLASPPDQLTKIPKTDDSGNLSGWIEALGVDGSYEPPVEKAAKPVACFYMLLRDPARPSKHEYYRAVYLTQRTLKGLINSIASKWSLEFTKVARTVRILERGLEVEMDDDVVRELTEGQDIILEIRNVKGSSANVKREWDMSDDEVVDGQETENAATEGYELRLKF